MVNKTEYITTAIVYPNSRIHLGWAWECISADWLTRAHRAMGRATRFATGMDEHSVNVQRAAEEKGLTPKVYCDQMAGDIRTVLGNLGVAFDRFIRTSDSDHEAVVSSLVEKAYRSGDIYKAKYEGHYCESCEAFYLDKDLVNGNCPHHGKPPKWISEENYFFKLSKYQKPLEELLARPDFLQPESRRQEILNFVQQGLKDFSISRSTFTWGIQLPWDPQHVVYVWFDALLNYVTASAASAADSTARAAGAPATSADPLLAWRQTPATHIVGKDITRFHCVYWPAMLMALDLPLPKRVFGHGWLNLRGSRMSKSSGNVVWPDEVVAQVGADPLRYYLLAENNFASDGNFAWDLMAAKVNSDLANDWGNLVNRTLSMTRKYFPDQAVVNPGEGKLPATADVRASFAKLTAELETAIADISPQNYAQACTARSRVLNLYIDQTKPWALAKAATPESLRDLHEVLYSLMEGIRWIATALIPILPFGMPEVFRQLNLPFPEGLATIETLQWGGGGTDIRFQPTEPKPIYPRIELPPELLE